MTRTTNLHDSSRQCTLLRLQQQLRGIENERQLTTVADTQWGPPGDFARPQCSHLVLELHRIQVIFKTITQENNGNLAIAGYGYLEIVEEDATGGRCSAGRWCREPPCLERNHRLAILTRRRYN